MCNECRHIMPNGAKCHSPALRGMAYCYFHIPGRRPAEGRSRPRNRPLKLPAIKDLNSIQIALGQVRTALSSSKIDPTRAGQLLHGLEIASVILGSAANAAPTAHPRELQDTERGRPRPLAVPSPPST